MQSHLVIREARRRAGITQAELAARAGTTQSAVARWETGRSEPAWERLQELVAACGFEISISLVPRRAEEEALLLKRLAMTPAERLRYLISAIPLTATSDAWDATGAGGEDSAFAPVEGLRHLVEHEVQFVVIGGLAATLMGSPFLTDDLDVTPAPDIENVRRLARALAAYGATPAGVSRPATTAEHLAPDRLQSVPVLRFVTPFGSLDVHWEPSGTRGYADLRGGAVRVDVGGAEVLVVSLADVIRSKEAAARADDRSTVPTLRRLAALATRERRTPAAPSA